MLIARRPLRAAFVALVTILALTVPAYAATDTVEPPKPEPVLVLRSFKTTPTALSVGNKFKLDLYFDNGVDVDAENVVVTLGAIATSATVATTMTTTTATPPATVSQVVVLGSNTRLVGAIAGKATNRRVSFDLVSDPKSGPGPYSLPVTIQYDSPNGGRPSVVQSVGLMFTRTLVFDVGALTYPREATAEAPFDVSVTVRNTNSFPINGVSLSFDATGVTWISRETTVGTLEPSREATLVAKAIAPTPGPLPMTMTITYQDDYNQTKRLSRQITVTIVPKPVPKPKAPSPESRLWLFLKALVGLGG